MRIRDFFPVFQRHQAFIHFLWYFLLAQLMANIKLYWNSLKIQPRKELCFMLIQSHWNKLYKNRRLLSHSLEKKKHQNSLVFLLSSFFFIFLSFLGLFACFFVSLEIVQNTAHSHRKLSMWIQVGLGLKFAYLLLRFLSFQIFIIFCFLHVRTNPTLE